MKSFLIPALALALAGCANEELETIGSGTIPCDGMDGSDGQGEQCLLA